VKISEKTKRMIELIEASEEEEGDEDYFLHSSDR
jgi:hypothetical protein